MPELPEVQTVVNDLLNLDIAGQAIKKITVRWRRSVNDVSDRRLNKYLGGRKIARISRRGKYVVFDLDDGNIFIIHLRMSGRIRYVRSRSPIEKHEHVGITLTGGFDIRFYDPRKFGRLFIGEDALCRIKKLGVEPLEQDFTFQKFQQLISSRNRMTKPLLLDQSIISGIGNIYADEALWQARIHPLRLSSSLKTEKAKTLYKSIRSVLKSAISNFGTSLGNGEGNFISSNKRRGRNLLQLKVYGRTGEKCLRCKRKIQRIVVSQRSSHICPRCQYFKKN